MAIELQCICGKALTLRDELAGKVIRCPQCAEALPVPVTLGEAVEIVEEAVATGPPPLPRSQQKAGGQAIDVVDVVEVVEEIEEAVSAGPPPLAKGPRKEGYTAAPAPRVEKSREPKKKKKKKSIYSETYGKEKPTSRFVFEEGWFGSGIVGGAAAMFVGLVMFLIMLLVGFISIYGLIFSGLFFFGGLLAMLQGLMDLYDE